MTEDHVEETHEWLLNAYLRCEQYHTPKRVHSVLTKAESLGCLDEVLIQCKEYFFSKHFETRDSIDTRLIYSVDLAFKKVTLKISNELLHPVVTNIAYDTSIKVSEMLSGVCYKFYHVPPGEVFRVKDKLIWHSAPGEYTEVNPHPNSRVNLLTMTNETAKVIRDYIKDMPFPKLMISGDELTPKRFWKRYLVTTPEEQEYCEENLGAIFSLNQPFTCEDLSKPLKDFMKNEEDLKE